MSKDSDIKNGKKVVVEAAGLSKKYITDAGVIMALRQASLRVCPKETIAIMGPSGSGKSTLLFLLGLLLSPTTGSYKMLGTDMFTLSHSEKAKFRGMKIGFVFQSADLVETCNVQENLELPLIYSEVPRQERALRIGKALERVHMVNRRNHPANRLSGGERQRVAIARALVNRPRLILADEPTGQLDRANGQRIMDYLKEIAEAGEAAVILATHASHIANQCLRICYLEDGVLYED